MRSIPQQNLFAENWNPEQEDDWWYVQKAGKDILVSHQHKQTKLIQYKLCSLLQSANKKLLQNLKQIIVPFAFLDGDPEYAAEALCESGTIVFYGKNHEQNGCGDLSYTLLHHELAHLINTNTGGVPQGLEKNWQKACLLDKIHMEQNLQHKADLDIFAQKRALAGNPHLKRRFLFASNFVTSYAQTGEHEDWAEAVSFYFHDHKYSTIWREGKDWITFREMYPHRKEVIEQYLFA